MVDGEDPDGRIRKLLENVKSIQLRWFDAKNAADARTRVLGIRDILKAPQWQRYVAFSSDEIETEMWSGRGGTSMTGVLLLAMSGPRILAMNVDGEIRPDQLMTLFGVMGIPNFQLTLDPGRAGQPARGK